MFDVSLIAIIVATLAGFGLGYAWYGPLFGAAWMADNGFTKQQLDANANPAVTYGATLALGLVTAYVFALFIGPSPSILRSTGSGLLVGVGWVATTVAMNYLFEFRPLRLLVIHAGYHVLRFGLIGLVFGLIG